MTVHDVYLFIFICSIRRLSEESFQQLLALVCEVQDEDLTLSFLTKVGGDLSSCCLNWELLDYLLQQSSAQTITVNLKKNRFLQDSITRLLPFLDRILFKKWLLYLFIILSFTRHGHMVLISCVCVSVYHVDCIPSGPVPTLCWRPSERSIKLRPVRLYPVYWGHWIRWSTCAAEIWTRRTVLLCFSSSDTVTQWNWICWGPPYQQGR